MNFFYFQTKKSRKTKVKIATPALTPKARIAEALGIRPIKSWQMTPDMRVRGGSNNAAARDMDRMRNSLPRLTLLGTNSELDYIDE